MSFVQSSPISTLSRASLTRALRIENVSSLISFSDVELDLDLLVPRPSDPQSLVAAVRAQLDPEMTPQRPGLA